MGANSKVVAISFSPPEMLEQARERARQLGFKNSFSAYVTKLVEDDISMHESPDAAGQAVRPHVNERITYKMKPKKGPKP